MLTPDQKAEVRDLVKFVVANRFEDFKAEWDEADEEMYGNYEEVMDYVLNYLED